MNLKLKFVSSGVIAFLVASPLVAAEKIVFSRDIQPLLESTCLSCHKDGKAEGGLLLHTRAQAIKGGDGGAAIVSGKPADSPLYTLTVLPKGHDDIMPPKGDPLTKPQSDALRQWIEEGADWPGTGTLAQRPRIKFAEDIQPILEFNCVACHRDGHAKGGCGWTSGTWLSRAATAGRASSRSVRRRARFTLPPRFRRTTTI